ncbi:MAG TPA: histidine kinase [Chitinophagaceae bacterium]|nr:histidine kinase [Chitinophagaceae bacterium]
MPTNSTIPPIEKSPPQRRQQVNDIGFRVILIPFFGIAIPLLTGMISGQHFTATQLKVSFLYTIFIAFVIWEGNRYLLFSMRSYVDWHKKPVRKIFVLLFGISFYTVPVSILLLAGWYRLFLHSSPNWQVVTSATLIMMICVIFITHVYETVFLVKQSENEMLRAEQFERARAEAALEALKNQIDPHFIFNSLNTLSYLIEEQPARARQFNDTLADVYRYILQNKAKDLVLLREEIKFLEDYFSLLKIRFEDAVQLQLEVDPIWYDQFLVPPISLQVLMENAIKHNDFDADASPLVLRIELKNNSLVVCNTIRKKQLRKPSSQIGLRNLDERYKFTTGKSISIAASNDQFCVVLPVLNIE